MVKHLI